ncbi:MAG: hypothetical protein CL910_10990 [Deltaproteobacteria bacterium]|nr:hypothetical protein [Deltaproteobacteria bacterium]
MSDSADMEESQPLTVWVLTVQEALWPEAADALGMAGYATVAAHWDDLAELEASRPDLVLVDLRDDEEPEKMLGQLDDHPGAARAPRLVLASSASQADALEIGLDPPTDFVLAQEVSLPWDAIRARLRRLLGLQLRAREVRHEWELADCARELTGAAAWSLDPEQGTYTCSAEIARQLDHRADWPEEQWSELLDHLPVEARADMRRAVTRIAEKGGTASFEHAIEVPGGERRVLLHRLRRLAGEGSALVGAVLDVTEERESFHRLQQLAHFDSLTGLMTRYHFLTHLAKALADETVHSLAILFLDLDGLKRVNDSLGHRGGDVLLRQTAERLRAVLRAAPELPNLATESERPVLGRLGGDEFIASLPGLDRGAASRVAEALVEAFREPFQVSGKRINATVSVGVAVAPHDAGIADELVRHADAAMYEAKRRGGDCRDVYRGELDRHHSRRREVRERLRHALVAGELEMHYQPRIQLRSGRLVGIEALMRWESPELGRVSPAEFVPIAEETGLIDRLGSFAIEQACHDLRRLDQAGLTDLRVSVNVSGAQLMEQGYGSKLFSAIQAAEAEPSRIELEVTESVALYGLQDVAGLLREVRNAGLYVSLDDFGTGYSSLSVLLDLPLDCLKLDQSLVRDLHMNPDAASVVRAMILLAHSLGLTVVAEGVTEEAQEQLLRELDCDEVQGFRFAPALPLPKLIEFASQGKSR